MNLSATRLKLYHECRLRYYRQYIQKAPRNENTAALLGIGLHKAIAEYYNGKNPKYVFQQEVNSKHNAWSERGLIIDYVYSMKKVHEKGAEFLDNFPFREFTPLYCELGFRLPYRSLLGTWHNIRGYIDMVTNNGSIVDFKSSSKRPKTIEDDIQFTVYIHAYKELYFELPKEVYWYHLKDNKKVYYDLEQFDKRWKEVERIVEMLELDTFEDLQVCGKCPFYCGEKNAADTSS